MKKDHKIYHHSIVFFFSFLISSSSPLSFMHLALCLSLSTFFFFLSLDNHIGKFPFQVHIYVLYGVWMATLASFHFKYIFTYSMEFGWPHWQVSISSIYLRTLWSLDGHIGKFPFQVYIYVLYGVWMATLASVHFKYIFTYSMDQSKLQLFFYK